MAIKTILVPLAGAAGDDHVLATAHAAATRFDSHLVALFVHPDPRSVLPYMTGAVPAGSVDLVLEAASRTTKEHAARARKTFDDFCAARSVTLADAPPAPGGVSAQWVEEHGNEVDITLHYARLNDLVALARPLEESPAPVLLESVLMESGRPLLVAPPKAVDAVATHVLVGWDGGAQAARAAAFAMPLLAVAAKITVVTAPEGAEAGATPEDFARHLAWHGITAETVTLGEDGGSEAGEGLLGEAAHRGADLLVMGGFGHSRFRELILGGATRHILTHAELPVLMAH